MKTESLKDFAREYIYDVVVRGANGKFDYNGEHKHIRARGMKGVATLLGVKLDDIVYVNKSIAE